MSQVFLSYSRADLPRAQVVVRRLEAQGFSVWWDSNLRGGLFAKQLEIEIKQAGCVVVLWSHSSADSDWVAAEADRGRIANKLVQVRLDPDCKVPLPFEWRHILEVTPWDPEPADERFQPLLDAVRLEVTRPSFLRWLRPIWRPPTAPKLLPWDIWFATALLTGAVVSLFGWGSGFLDHKELALYGGAVLLGWLIWLIVRGVVLLRMARLPVAPRRVLFASASIVALSAVWAFSFQRIYSFVPFPEGVSGFYVARIEDDRWNHLQNQLVSALTTHLADFQVPQLEIRPLPRRVNNGEEALRLLGHGNAVLLIRGRAVGTAQRPVVRMILDFRQAAGVFPGKNLNLTDTSGPTAATATLTVPRDFGALAEFFAGYALYHEELWGRAETTFKSALNRLQLPGAPAEELFSGRLVDVTRSLRGTLALFLGNCLAIRGDLEGALRMYDEALQVVTMRDDPRFVEPLSNKGFVLQRLNRLDEAITTFEQAGEICRSSERRLACAYLHHNLGVARALHGDHAKARHELSEAINILDVEAKIHPLVPARPREEQDRSLMLQSFNHQKWSWAAAKQLEVIRVEGSSPPERYEELLKEAEMHLERANSVWPTGERPAAFRLTKARIDVLRGRWQEGRQTLENLIAKEEDQLEEPEVYLLLAVARICTQDAKGYIEALTKVSKPSSSDATGGFRYLKYWTDRCRAKK